MRPGRIHSVAIRSRPQVPSASDPRCRSLDPGHRPVRTRRRRDRRAGAARTAPTTKGHALRLSLYTDLSLRLLLYLAALEVEAWTTTPTVARAFGVSLHHLQKVARGLAGAGYIEARQGRTGGVRLARPPAEVRLGAVVAELEGLGCLVECGRGPCPLAGRCLLKTALDAAERGFIRELDRFTLADVLAGPTGATLRALIGREAGGGADPGP